MNDRTGVGGCWALYIHPIAVNFILESEERNLCVQKHRVGSMAGTSFKQSAEFLAGVILDLQLNDISMELDFGVLYHLLLLLSVDSADRLRNQGSRQCIPNMGKGGNSPHRWRTVPALPWSA